MPEAFKRVLTSYFYELARDEVPVGTLNKMLANATKNSEYSDEELANWAERHVEKLFAKSGAE
jgi:hypothetical protein